MLVFHSDRFCPTEIQPCYILRNWFLQLIQMYFGLPRAAFWSDNAVWIAVNKWRYISLQCSWIAVSKCWYVLPPIEARLWYRLLGTLNTRGGARLDTFAWVCFSVRPLANEMCHMVRVLQLATHSLTAASQPRLSETEQKWFVFETFWCIEYLTSQT